MPMLARVFQAADAPVGGSQTGEPLPTDFARQPAGPSDICRGDRFSTRFPQTCPDPLSVPGGSREEALLPDTGKGHNRHPLSNRSCSQKCSLRTGQTRIARYRPGLGHLGSGLATWTAPQTCKRQVTLPIVPALELALHRPSMRGTTRVHRGDSVGPAHTPPQIKGLVMLLKRLNRHLDTVVVAGMRPPAGALRLRDDR